MPKIKKYGRETLEFSAEEVEQVMRIHAEFLGHTEFAKFGKPRPVLGYVSGMSSLPKLNGYSFVIGDESWPAP